MELDQLRREPDSRPSHCQITRTSTIAFDEESLAFPLGEYRLRHRGTIVGKPGYEDGFQVLDGAPPPPDDQPPSDDDFDAAKAADLSGELRPPDRRIEPRGADRRGMGQWIT